MAPSEAELDAAALQLARRLDVALFFYELHEEHPRIHTLRNDATRIRQKWGIDLSRFLPTR